MRHITNVAIFTGDSDIISAIEAVKDVAIYLTRCIRNDTLKGIGKAFGIDKNSTVGSVLERVKREMGKNKNISKRVEKLKDILGKSQE